jgi:oxygen-dependent protoporphyrinogen oxidase
MKRLVIIGAGISGLCAAHEAARHRGEVAEGLEILVLEASPTVGGKARTIERDGWLVEAGPAGYLDNEPEFDELLARTGIAGEKVEANEAAARRYLLHGRLREVRANPLAFARSGIVGPTGLLRMMAEPFIPRAAPERAEAESIWDFARRRLGVEAADKLIAPMVLGVFAGDARRLSVSAGFPQLVALERDHGSLIRGMIATRKRRTRDQRFSSGTSGKLVSFRHGLQSVAVAIAESDDFTVRCDAKVESVEAVAAPLDAAATGNGGDERGRPRYRVLVGGDGAPIETNAVIAAAEAFANADAVADIAPEIAAALREITTPPVVVVSLGFKPQAASSFPTGFGVLIPRDQGYRILGSIWDSQLFSGRSPEGHVLVRAMLGGSVDPEVAALDDDALVELVRDELARIFGLTSAPVFAEVMNWRRAIPQYDLQHPSRVARIEAALEHIPGFFLAGNGLQGVAFSKSAVTGMRQGRRAALWLAGAANVTGTDR